jgi:hypothetical protein
MNLIFLNTDLLKIMSCGQSSFTRKYENACRILVGRPLGKLYVESKEMD